VSKNREHNVILVPAAEPDAPRMGRMMVETWLAAHRGQISDGQWQRRRDEWTAHVSAEGWARTLRRARDGSLSHTSLYLAVGEDYAEGIAGLVMAGPATSGPWDDAGEVFALYVRPAAQERRIGRRLLTQAVDDLIGHGMNRIVIRCLDTNTAANAFYEHLGGVVVGHAEIEDYGYTNVERIYGWQDASALLR
jgi:ribosomal protein S18 acetylase RimI-like enzyme